MTATMNQVPLQGILLHPHSMPFLSFHRSAMTVAQFDPTGRHIFVGTSTGSVLVFNTRTKTVSGAIIRHFNVLNGLLDGC